MNSKRFVSFQTSPAFVGKGSTSTTVIGTPSTLQLYANGVQTSLNSVRSPPKTRSNRNSRDLLMGISSGGSIGSCWLKRRQSSYLFIGVCL